MSLVNESFKDNYARYRDKSAEKGLGFVFQTLFSTIPAGIGHVLDTILRSDELFIKGSHSHLNGLFGGLFGIVPAIAGRLIGEILQQIVNIPMYIGYFLLDFPLNWITQRLHWRGRIDQAMLGQWFAPLLFQAIRGLFTFLTQTPPEKMNGLFGFMFGLLPQTGRYLIQLIASPLICPFHFVVDKLCDGIHIAYTKLGALTNKKKPEPDSPKTAPEVKKIGRFRRPEQAPQAVKDELNEMINQQVDLYATLGVAMGADDKAIKAAFRKKSIITHPDKVAPCRQDGELEEQYTARRKTAERSFQQVDLAYKVLTDPIREPHYRKAYQSWQHNGATTNVNTHSNLFADTNPTFSKSTPVANPAYIHTGHPVRQFRRPR